MSNYCYALLFPAGFTSPDSPHVVRAFRSRLGRGEWVGTGPDVLHAPGYRMAIDAAVLRPHERAGAVARLAADYEARYGQRHDDE